MNANQTVRELSVKLHSTQVAEITAKAEVKKLNEEMDMILKEVDKLKDVRKEKRKAIEDAGDEQRKKAKTVG